MRILFFTHYFPPEVNAPANRTHEHCREWVAAGHEVHVVTCIPSHPAGEPFPGFRMQWYQHDLVDGIDVHRVWTYLAPNRGLVRRTLNYLSFMPSAVIRALQLGRFDIAIGTSPQFFCAVATWLYTRVRPVPWVFELRDLWPESIPAVGAMQKSFALRMLEKFALKMYRDATGVVCVTESFVRLLASRGIAPSKLHFVPNGIVPAFWRQASRAQARRGLGVSDAEVLVSYVGTIGMAHGLSTVLEAAAALQSTSPEVRLLIVGDGAELAQLRSSVEQQGLRNVTFSGLVARERVPGVLAATDIALVTLKASDVFKTVLPSKMFEAMAAGCAIVLGVDGEARATLERSRSGIAVRPGDANALTDAIQQLAGDSVERSRMGSAGMTFVDREFSRSRWAARYLEILEGIRRDLTMREPVTTTVK